MNLYFLNCLCWLWKSGENSSLKGGVILVKFWNKWKHSLSHWNCILWSCKTFAFSLDKKNPYFIFLITVQASKFPLSSKLTFTVTTAWAGSVCSKSTDCRLTSNILLMSLFFLHSKVFSGNFCKEWYYFPF